MTDIPAQSIPTSQRSAVHPSAHQPGTSRQPLRVLAPLLSLLVPGLGHLALGARRKGVVMMAITALALLPMLVLAPQNPFDVLALAVRPNILIAGMLVNIALLGFRLYAVVDTARLADQSGTNLGSRSIASLVLVIWIALAAMPHVALGYYDIVTYRTLDRVFDQQSPAVREAFPAEVELTRPVQLAPGVTAAAPPVTIPEEERAP